MPSISYAIRPKIAAHESLCACRRTVRLKAAAGSEGITGRAMDLYGQDGGHGGYVIKVGEELDAAIQAVLPEVDERDGQEEAEYVCGDK